MKKVTPKAFKMPMMPDVKAHQEGFVNKKTGKETGGAVKPENKSKMVAKPMKGC